MKISNIFYKSYKISKILFTYFVNAFVDETNLFFCKVKALIEYVDAVC